WGASSWSTASTIGVLGRLSTRREQQRAISLAEAAGRPPSLARPSQRAGFTSKPRTAKPAPRKRSARAVPSKPTPTRPIVSALMGSSSAPQRALARIRCKKDRHHPQAIHARRHFPHTSIIALKEGHQTTGPQHPHRGGEAAKIVSHPRAGGTHPGRKQ